MRRWRRPLLAVTPVVVCAALGARAAAAAVPAGTVDDQLGWHSWPSVAHTTTVRALLPTPDGLLWIGTSEGVVRFDGRRMIPLDDGRLPGLVGGNIERLFLSSDGDLWVGSRVQGLSRIRGATVATRNASDGRTGDLLIRDFAETRDGTIWVATFGGVARFARGSFDPVLVNRGLPDERVDALAVDAAGTLWAGTRGGLARLDPAARTWHVEAIPGLGAVRTFALKAEPDGTLWVSTMGAGLLARRPGTPPTWQRYGPAEGMRGDYVHALLRDRHGRLWAGAKNGGLLRREGDRFVRVGLPLPPRCDQSIEALAEDSEGGIFIATESCGLHRVYGRPVRTFGRDDGLPMNEILGLAGGPDGTVWVGTRGSGMVRIRPGETHAEPLACAPGAPCDACWDIAPGTNGEMWVVCGTNELLHFDGKVLGRAKLPPGLEGAAMVMRARDGALWLALERVVIRWLDGVATRITAQEPLAGKRVFLDAPDGAVWIAADDGVAVWRKGQVSITRYTRGDPEAETANMHLDAAGSLWLATKGGGLRLVRGGRSVTFGVAHGLPTNWITQVLEDDLGRLWMSTGKGILRIDKRELEAVADGRRKRVQPSVYDGSDDVLMRSDAFGHPAGWKGPDGRLWFGTFGGVVVVDPRAVGKPPPPVVLEELRLGAEPVAPAAGGREVLASDAGPLDLHARFFARSFAAPGSISFRHRLVGNDLDWIEAAPDGTAHYPKLEPGRYQLLVAARHRDGGWSPEPARFAFVIGPPFYRSLWFAPLLALGVGLVLIAAHRLRLARTRAALNAVMAERARIARDVHDTLAQAFVATSVQLECVHRALRTDDRPTIDRHVETARRMVKESLEEARRSVWVLRPQALERGLPSALQTLVGSAASGETVVDLQVTGTVRSLPPMVEANLLRVAQEGVANAYRHARASRITLALAFSARSVILSISDDGTGLDNSDSGGHPRERGLAGMKERAAEIGGTLTIQSAPGGGTTVRMEVRG